MDNERPLILFPRMEEGEKSSRNSRPPIFKRPSFERQIERVIPKISSLEKSFSSRNIRFNSTAKGLDTELALVFEVIGSVDNFYKTISKINGMEWLTENYNNEIEPDEDFYNKGSAKESSKLSGKIHCIMSSKKAFT